MKRYSHLIALLDPRCTEDHIGLIPSFLDIDDERRAREQFNERYAFGGGWRPQEGFTKGQHRYSLKYPGDPAMHPLAVLQFRNERVFFYPHAYVAIWQENGTFEVCRMD